MPTNLSLSRRVVLTLASAGYDVRPLLRRVRDVLLRQHRAEIAIAFERVQCAQRQIQQNVALLDDRMHDSHPIIERDIVGLQSQIGDLQRDIADLQRYIGHLQGDIGGLQRDVTGLPAGIASLEQSLYQTRSELTQRNFALEQLLTGTASKRPAGAARAVQQLPKPAVSVILPTYNRAGVLGEAVASVQAQRFPHWELVIVDDGSTDDTEAVVTQFLADKRIRYVRQPKADQKVARNLGIALTSAPLIGYLDSDNVWYPDFLARAVDCLASEPEVDFVYGALVTSHHPIGQRCILWSPFDRNALLAGNYIDTNVIVHRRTLVTRYGGWDPKIWRVSDWDLVLRYTVEKPARALDVLAAHYRRYDDQGATLTAPYWPDEVAIRRKWFPPAVPSRRPRVLYLIRRDPRFSGSHVETELRCMLAWGVHIEVWRASSGAFRNCADVPVHDGALVAAIEAVQPDVLHAHGLDLSDMQRIEREASGMPVTLDIQDSDIAPDSLAAWLAHRWVRSVYASPDLIALSGLSDVRLKPMSALFDTNLFKPRLAKDRRLIVRTAIAMPGQDLEFFLAAARLLPEYRCVLALLRYEDAADHVDHLQGLRARMGSPAELLFDVSREDVAALVGEAGIYLHTMPPSDRASETLMRQRIAIAEAMATGCYCLVPDVPALAGCVQDAGATYRDLDRLIELVRTTEDWSDATWKTAWLRAVERAHQHHAEVLVLQTMFNDWMALSEPSAR